MVRMCMDNQLKLISNYNYRDISTQYLYTYAKVSEIMPGRQIWCAKDGTGDDKDNNNCQSENLLQKQEFMTDQT